MRKVQSSEAKARLPQFLDDVERGETIIITRHGRPVAYLVPAPTRDQDRVRRAIEGILALRREVIGEVTADELLTFRREGQKS